MPSSFGPRRSVTKPIDHHELFFAILRSMIALGFTVRFWFSRSTVIIRTSVRTRRSARSCRLTTSECTREHRSHRQCSALNRRERVGCTHCRKNSAAAHLEAPGDYPLFSKSSKPELSETRRSALRKCLRRSRLGPLPQQVIFIWTNCASAGHTLELQGRPTGFSLQNIVAPAAVD